MELTIRARSPPTDYYPEVGGWRPLNDAILSALIYCRLPPQKLSTSIMWILLVRPMSYSRSRNSYVHKHNARIIRRLWFFKLYSRPTGTHGPKGIHKPIYIHTTCTWCVAKVDLQSSFAIDVNWKFIHLWLVHYITKTSSMLTDVNYSEVIEFVVRSLLYWFLRSLSLPSLRGR